MEEEEALPPNWSSRVDPKYNRRYYYNKLTKESSWIKPVAESRADKSSNPVSPQSANDSFEQLVTDDKGRVWQKVYSKTYDRCYYYDRKTGQTTWVHPTKRKSASRPTVSKIDSDASSSNASQKRKSKTSEAKGDQAESSDDEEDTRGSDARSYTNLDDDPENFQKRIMEQFPALKHAFQELEEGQRRLQRERLEHEAKVKREMDMVNARLEELKRATASVSGLKNEENGSSSSRDKIVENTTSSEVPSSAMNEPRPRASQSISGRPRNFTLEHDLKRFSIDLERRSISVVEKRKSMRAASGIRPDDIKSVMEEANRLAAERGNEPATAETAAKQLSRLSGQFGESKSADEDDEAIDEIKYEMDGVSRGLDYAVKEAAAQSEAAQEAKDAGENSEYYALLGLPENANDAELKKAYRKRLIEWHPDKVRPEKRDQAVRMTDLIQNAFKVLSDPWEREIYDWFGFEQYLLHVKVISCFKNYLVAGIELVKHPRKGRPRKRVVWLDRDFTEILTYRRRIMEDQRNGKEKIKGVSIHTITEVTTGRSTEVLKRTGKASHSGRYFSLVCADRTLDFECPTEESCTFIATRIKLLIIDLKRDRDWMYRHYDEQQD